MASVKFERTKPHINVGTIGHINPNGRTSLMSSLNRLRVMAALAAIAGQAGNTTTSPLGGWQNDSGTSTFVNTNNGPMMESGNREDRRNKKKRKHGPSSGSKYKKGRWWE